VFPIDTGPLNEIADGVVPFALVPVSSDGLRYYSAGDQAPVLRLLVQPP
jgi:hypothetical protein